MLRFNKEGINIGMMCSVYAYNKQSPCHALGKRSNFATIYVKYMYRI